MMKKCSKITAAVLSVILAFSFFCVTAFAANEEKAKTDIEIKNDSFFIKIPAGYKMMQSPFYNFLKSESPRIGDRIAVLYTSTDCDLEEIAEEFGKVITVSSEKPVFNKNIIKIIKGY